MSGESPAPEERGRYAVFRNGDGSLTIARAGPICDTCVGCGCGEQLTPVDVPVWASAFLTAIRTGKPLNMDTLPGPLRMLAKARMRGNTDDR